MAYSYDQLQQLWIQNGGADAVAGLMAQIGLAESNGNPNAINSSSGACGLWQIHPPEAGCQDPGANAQMAVRKYNEQGLGAWEAYSNGAYRKFGPDTGPTTSIAKQSSSACVYGFSLFGSTICADGLIGGGSAAAGLGLAALGIFILAKEL